MYYLWILNPLTQSCSSPFLEEITAMSGQSAPGEGRLDQGTRNVYSPKRCLGVLVWGFGQSFSATDHPLSLGISVQIFGRCTWGSLHYRGSMFTALPRMAFCVCCTCFVFAIFKPQKYALGRKRGKWWYLGGREGMKIISQSCSPLCGIMVHKKERGAQGLHQGPLWVTHTAVYLRMITGQLWCYTNVTKDGNCLEPLHLRTPSGFLLWSCPIRDMQEDRCAALQDSYMKLIFKHVWHYLLHCFCFHPSLCSLLLPDHHFPQTMLITPAAPPLLAMTCGAHRAAGRQGLSLHCCWVTARQAKSPGCSWLALSVTDLGYL